MSNLVVYKKETNVSGITAKIGYASWTDDFTGLLNITNGEFKSNGSCIQIFTLKKGGWISSWSYNFPDDLMSALFHFDEEIRYRSAIEVANAHLKSGQKLFISNDNLYFTYMIDEDRHEYQIVFETTGTAGVYNCYFQLRLLHDIEFDTNSILEEFDIKPTGFKALTVDEYLRLRKISDNIIKEALLIMASGE